MPRRASEPVEAEDAPLSTAAGYIRQRASEAAKAGDVLSILADFGQHWHSAALLGEMYESGGGADPGEALRSQTVTFTRALGADPHTYAQSVFDLVRENWALRSANAELAERLSQLSALEERIEVLETALGQEEIVLREVPRDEAKKEIRKLFGRGETLYFEDIVTRLQLDLELVVDICNELIQEGEIGVHDGSHESR